MVTAGLMWQPEILPIEYTIATTASPKAVEMASSSAPVKGAPPVPPRATNSPGTAPAPTNTSTAVPRASAPSFCANVFSSIDPLLFAGSGRGISRTGLIDLFSIMPNNVRAQYPADRQLSTVPGGRHGTAAGSPPIQAA